MPTATITKPARHGRPMRRPNAKPVTNKRVTATAFEIRSARPASSTTAGRYALRSHRRIHGVTEQFHRWKRPSWYRQAALDPQIPLDAVRFN